MTLTGYWTQNYFIPQFVSGISQYYKKTFYQITQLCCWINIYLIQTIIYNSIAVVWWRTAIWYYRQRTRYSPNSKASKLLRQTIFSSLNKNPRETAKTSTAQLSVSDWSDDLLLFTKEKKLMKFTSKSNLVLTFFSFNWRWFIHAALSQIYVWSKCVADMRFLLPSAFIPRNEQTTKPAEPKEIQITMSRIVNEFSFLTLFI